MEDLGSRHAAAYRADNSYAARDYAAPLHHDYYSARSLDTEPTYPMTQAYQIDNYQRNSSGFRKISNYQREPSGYFQDGLSLSYSAATPPFVPIRADTFVSSAHNNSGFTPAYSPTTVPIYEKPAVWSSSRASLNSSTASSADVGQSTTGVNSLSAFQNLPRDWHSIVQSVIECQSVAPIEALNPVTLINSYFESKTTGSQIRRVTANDSVEEPRSPYSLKRKISVCDNRPVPGQSIMNASTEDLQLPRAHRTSSSGSRGSEQEVALDRRQISSVSQKGLLGQLPPQPAERGAVSVEPETRLFAGPKLEILTYHSPSQTPIYIEFPAEEIEVRRDDDATSTENGRSLSGNAQQELPANRDLDCVATSLSAEGTSSGPNPTATSRTEEKATVSRAEEGASNGSIPRVDLKADKASTGSLPRVGLKADGASNGSIPRVELKVDLKADGASNDSEDDNGVVLKHISSLSSASVRTANTFSDC